MAEDYDPDEDDAKVFSVLSGTKRQNRWRVAAWTDILTVFGRTFLDLRQAEARADELNMSVWCLFGSVTILVPEGCDVRPSGMAFLAVSDSLVPETDQQCDFPPVDVEANVVFGRVRIRTALGRDAPEPLPLDEPVVRAPSAPPVVDDVGSESGAAAEGSSGPVGDEATAAA